MRQLQVAFNRKQFVEFVVDPESLEKLREVHSRIPQTEPVPTGPHALVASLLRHCVCLAAPGSPISQEVRDVLASHVAYQRPIIATHSPTSLGDAANGFKVRQPKEASGDAIRQCVGELFGYLKTLPVGDLRSLYQGYRRQVQQLQLFDRRGHWLSKAFSHLH
jgi:hypothetical protein